MKETSVDTEAKLAPVYIEGAAVEVQKNPVGGRERVIDAVISDLETRARFGREKYGQDLMAHDGRDNLTDLYQELLDSVMYARKEIMERATVITIPMLQRAVHENAVNHGWWESERPVPEILCLIHSEVSEALEAYRNHDDENFAEELADIGIRLLDAAEGYGINLEAEILKKHEKNKARSYRHGGKAV